MNEEIEALGLDFDLCLGLNGATGARQVLELIRELGGGFLRLTRDQVEPDPFRWIDPKKGDVHVCIEHPLLYREPITSPGRSLGSASFTFWPEGMFIKLSQDVAYHDLNRVDQAALGQLAFACLLYPHLRPTYGWIDEMGQNAPDARDAALTKLKYILWANFFGPAYVERYGRDFLLGAPGWKVEKLDDGGVLYVISPSFLNPEQVVSQREIETYFRTKVPRIRRYRAKPVL